jgi:hypothetical protein
VRTHHVIRGGLIFIGTGIGAMSLTASASVVSSGVTAAPAAGHVVGDAGDGAEVPAPLPAAPAAVPVVVALPVEIEAAPTPDPEPRPEAVAQPEPEPPVVQAGAGPAAPVEGATTLIDSIAIER